MPVIQAATVCPRCGEVFDALPGSLKAECPVCSYCVKVEAPAIPTMQKSSTEPGQVVCRSCGKSIIPEYIHCSLGEKVVYIILLLCGILPFLLAWTVRSRLMGCPECKVICGMSSKPSPESRATIMAEVCGFLCFALFVFFLLSIIGGSFGSLLRNFT